MVALGWIAGTRRLAAPITGDHVIKANVAFAVIALSLTLLIDPRTRLLRRALRAGVAAAVVMGALTTLEWLIDRSIGIDELLVDDPWTATGLPAGRPAPLVAVVIVLLGSAVAVGNRSPRLRDAALIAATALSVTSLVGHAFGVDAFVAVAGTYAVPVEASALLTLLGAGAIMTANPSPLLRLLLEGSSTGAFARRIATCAVSLPLVGGLTFTGLVAIGVEETTAAWLITVAATGCALAAGWRTVATVDDVGRHLRTVINSIPEGVYEARFDGTLVMANDPLGQLLGYRDATHLLAEVDNVAGRWVHPDQRRALVDAVAAGTRVGTIDVELRRRDGDTFVGELSYRVVVTAHGDPVGLRGTIRDVSAVRRLQHEAAQAEQRFRLSFHTGPLGRAVLDLRADPLRFAEVNVQLADMLGYAVEDLLALDPRPSGLDP
jgi:PAS domain S-box-containing protein